MGGKNRVFLSSRNDILVKSLCMQFTFYVELPLC